MVGGSPHAPARPAPTLKQPRSAAAVATITLCRSLCCIATKTASNCRSAQGLQAMARSMQRNERTPDSAAGGTSREETVGAKAVDAGGAKPVHDKPVHDKPWIFRTYAGHSTAAASNALYRTNLSKGQTGLSVAFDLPTQTGYDSDHPLARGEV